MNIPKIKLQVKSERRNLGTFTALSSIRDFEDLIQYGLSKNYVDRNAYSVFTEAEQVVEKFMKSLYKFPNGKMVSTSGSTESILLALQIARDKAKLKKQIKEPNIILSELTHYSFFKCAKLLGIEVKIIDVDRDFKIDCTKVRESIDQNTIMVVGVMMNTELGTIDDMSELNKIAKEFDLQFHIDAAIGGFIIPFLDIPQAFNFADLDILSSINISGHKFGLSLPGCGLLLIKDQSDTQFISEDIDYLSSGKDSIDGLLVTKSGLGILSLAENIEKFGVSGYSSFVNKYIQTKKVAVNEFEKLGFDVLPNPIYAPHIILYGETARQFSEFLNTQGWIQSTHFVKPLKEQIMRIVIKRGQENLITSDLLQDAQLFASQFKKESRMEVKQSFIKKFNY